MYSDFIKVIKVSSTAQRQQNLKYLAKIADAQPQASSSSQVLSQRFLLFNIFEKTKNAYI